MSDHAESERTRNCTRPLYIMARTIPTTTIMPMNARPIKSTSQQLKATVARGGGGRNDADDAAGPGWVHRNVGCSPGRKWLMIRSKGSCTNAGVKLNRISRAVLDGGSMS